MLRLTPAILATLCGVSFASIGYAQGFPVTTGEHDGFTRVVIHAPPGTGWELEGDARGQVVRLTPDTAQLDISRVFTRIARTRLSEVQAEAGALRLDLACDCELRSWEERPGLIVIDIADPAPDAPSPAVALSPSELPTLALPAPETTASAPGFSASGIGETLARRHMSERITIPPEAAEMPATAAAALTAELGSSLAEALGQGLLEAAVPGDTTPPVQLLDAPHESADLPANMRVTNVTQRRDPDAAPEPQIADICRDADALAFLETPMTEPFGQVYGRLSRGLYGEFDQPDAEVRRGLIELYLASGFGAEARALIANHSDPVYGRELLIGLADVFERRNSNSRMRLAQLTGCEGPASVMAVLAGAASEDLHSAAPAIALIFTGFTPAMRAMIGVDLAKRLIEADAVDAARVVVGSTRRSEWVDPTVLDLIDARLDQARGFSDVAFARLTHAQSRDTPGVLARLLLALETGNRADAELLATAEALASTERGNAEGIEIMAVIVRSHAFSGAHAAGFAALDRIASWRPEHSETRVRMGQLADVMWLSVAQKADDLSFMQLVLGRDDWRDEGALRLETRQALAARFVDQGLASTALTLVPEAQDHTSEMLRARAHIELGDPQAALEILTDRDSPEAALLRARALEALGENARAAETYEALSRVPEATSAAISASDWRRLERLTASDAAPDGRSPLEGISRAIAQPPGYLDQPLPAVAPPVGPQDAPPAQTAADQPEEAPEVFDFERLGLITRSETLLGESARLRDSLSSLLHSASVSE
ncbi:hypothetical protein [Pararhodobacter oceanensis]|uniref:hypothetical protein n=1 Tax=Pararhodobacter oceanensis TaxID=2172121 RepID=UPI003A8DEB5F